jgi:hypothetical protein
MPLQTLLRAAVPFVGGAAVAIFVAELTRTGESPSQPFPDTWFRQADRADENLWSGEPAFDWGD